VGTIGNSLSRSLRSGLRQLYLLSFGILVCITYFKEASFGDSLDAMGLWCKISFSSLLIYYSISICTKNQYLSEWKRIWGTFTGKMTLDPNVRNIIFFCTYFFKGCEKMLLIGMAA